MAKTKKEVTGASALTLNEAFRCGECLHYKKHKHSSHEELCKDEGVRSFAIAPKCFTPDVSQIAQNSDMFVQLSALFSSYTPKQKRILLGMLRASPKTKKKEYPFGTKLYLKIGKDYISNYVSGYVMGYTSSGEMMLSGSPDMKTRGSSFLAFSESTEGFLTASQWKQKRKELREANKIQDPKAGIIQGSSLDNYEPPTIDSAPASWHDKKQEPKKRKRSDAVDKSITI